MPSLMELVDRVNKGESVDPAHLEIYQESANSAEKFLAHHSHALLDLRQAHQHILQSLEAIDYADQKVLNQFISVSSFLGLSDLRAQPIVKFGASAIARREWSLGMEAIQNGIAYDLLHGGAFTSNRENCRFVATQYDRISQCVPFAVPKFDWTNKQTRIALIVSGLSDDDSASRAVVSLARNLDPKRFTLNVYCTESTCRREKQLFTQAAYTAASSKRGKEILDLLAKQSPQAWFAPLDGDILSATRALAEQLVKDQIDVALFDATQADPIAAVLAGWDIARVKINLCRRTPLHAPGTPTIAYLDQARFESDKDYWQNRGVESRFILEGIDIEEPLEPAPQRSAYGIPDQAFVLATAGNDLDRTLSEPFIEAIVSILRANPQTIYLIAGEGELAWQKRKFEANGVGKRIGYAGRRKDLGGFLRMADLYLCEFPVATSLTTLLAMAASRPVLAARWGDEIEQSQAASFVGSDGAIPGRDATAYVERVGRVIRETQVRAKLGKTMRQRVEQHFCYSQTARHLEQLCDQLIQQRNETPTAGKITPRQEQITLAQVA
ncbi:MAG TPA: glycosyltransferase family 4 protein [Tepidisphaeraceae bacterium]|nr:glycosyltransferase family 4 protein [Tepidisphaeraceae bacterium]